VAVFFISEPNFDQFACKYFVLNLNKIQKCFEFEFPEVEQKTSYFLPKTGSLEKRDIFTKFSEMINQLKREGNLQVEPDLFVGITSVKLTKNFFWTVEDNFSVITTVDWEKLFSPPSVFEYLTHCIIGSVIQMAHPLVGSHHETRGCLLDFTLFKRDDKVSILLGYICDSCIYNIEKFLGKDIVDCIKSMCSRNWIGEIEDPDSVAHGMKKFFKVDLDKDTGFYKTPWEKIKESFIELPKEIILIVLSAFLGALFGAFIASLFR